MGTEPGTTNSSGSGGSGSRGAKKRDSWHTAPGTNGTSGDGGGRDEPPDSADTKEAAANGSSATTKPTTETAQILQSGKERNMVVALTGERRRETWSQKAEFLLAVIGFAVDLGNVWRFPYICYQNGGGAFLIPYCIMLLFGGLPLFYMELALGQFHRCGCLSIWKRICPALKGVGYAICLIDIYMGMYYNTIIGWAVYYLFASFSYELPWTKCGNPWNTENCSPVTGRVNATTLTSTTTTATTLLSSMATDAASAGVTLVAAAVGNSTMATTTMHPHYYHNSEQYLLSSALPSMLSNLTTSTVATVVEVVREGPALSSPAREFFERQVLEQYKSNGLDFMGPVKPSLALCVFGVFVLVYFSLWKGVRSAGKVVWVTALAPYVVLLILLARGVTLPGAAEGIRYYLTPQWDKLNNSRVWIDAASQIFFSLGPGFGTLLALSSYNKFNNNCYRDALLTSSINCLTSFLAGFVIFSVLGYMAQVQNKSIEEVGLEGPGLVFIVYPEAIAMMKGSVFWSIIFFLMLITLGLDSTFGGLEAMITALCDEYPRTIGRRRELFVLILLGLIYICALPTMTYGGVYLVNFLNVYGPGLAILFVVFVEAAGVFWFYGVENFSADIEQMLGKKPSLFWRICWKYISPTFLFCILIFSLLGYEEMLGEEYEYPEWSVAAGWALTLSSVLCIPTYMIYKFLRSPGNCKDRLRLTFKPEPLIPTAIPGQLYTGTAV
ncbi:sodium-dependent serotonin transporter [Anopheles stephensi]|uniref:sodium-dependent serotonin transporter n=1 Tax=Anopheles stephensi TaxID=30069 RepID=UPI001658826D|nr:sodium-dependent serotonin transporter [Anopheles stephensi]XP_035898744.1 sodium-dependent serotonin transporter [Anopheles stephensi]XP_035898745.1 sodium-dependent serotonin transporter [Anopheles stephensi]XP_035898746.1 sodium-dependent serotonin transporter [Anopheles stephensi]XP_035898747.1 sodium-dependent serotonin transporter [Anopheles stephensi]XP_035898748.1 sodium-dependent serotonin transporter [Anopheles stephensi]XP_035898749.1 sodium-dependent serotonin transporter [Anop